MLLFQEEISWQIIVGGSWDAKCFENNVSIGRVGSMYKCGSEN